MTQSLFDTGIFCHVYNTSSALMAVPTPKIATNNCKHRPVLCKNFSLLFKHPDTLCHLVFLSGVGLRKKAGRVRQR